MLKDEKKVGLFVEIPSPLRLELDEMILQRKKRGEKAKIVDVLTEYIKSGIETDKSKYPQKYSFTD